MPFIKPTSLLLLFACLLSASVLEFRTTAEVDTSGAEPKSMKLRCMSWQDHTGQRIYYKDGDNYVPLEVRVKRPSAPATVCVAEPLRLLLDGKDEGQYREFAVLELPEVSNRLLLLIHQMRGEELMNAQVDLLPDPIALFPAGGVVLANLSGDGLEVVFEGVSSILAPGEFFESSKGIPESGGFLPLQLKNMSGQIVYESRFYAQPSRCKIAYIYPPKSLGRKHSVKFMTEMHHSEASVSKN